ncbi:MAG: nitrogen regulation protein NR(II) [Spirulina sp.]
MTTDAMEDGAGEALCNQSPEGHGTLTHSEQRLRQIFEYSNDAIFVIDPQGDRILEANPKASEFLGYSREELLTTVKVSSVHPHDLSEFQRFGNTVLQQGHGWTDELSCMTKAGVAVPAEISAAVVSLDGRHCIISMVRDITTRKQAQAATERLAEIGELAAMIVHEVRSPLTTILMGLESFQAMDLPDRAQQRLTLALEEASRLKQLLNEILQYAREPILAPLTFDFVTFAYQLKEHLDTLPAMQGRSLLLTSDLPEVWITGDPDKLKQVFINLVRNACEAIAPGDTVTWSIAASPHPTSLWITLHNGGEPIPPEVLRKLGQPFFTTKPGGNGLGLAIVKRIVESHRGEITLESSAEAGTTVRVVLPRIATA